MKNKILYLKSKKFSYSKISYGFFYRIGGVSKAPFDSLNCSKLSGDNKNNVKKNISIAMNSLNLNKKKLIIGKQIHSNKVKEIRKSTSKEDLIADGFITKNKEICLGILTADCAPIFFYDPDKCVIGVAHAGWKGCLSNICKNIVKSMVKIGSTPKNIKAIIGPCIKVRNYEIDNMLYLRFVKKDKKYKKFFKKTRGGKYKLDLAQLLKNQLNDLNLSSVVLINEDTYSKESKYFSHRRSSHFNQNKTGRMINLIGFS